MSGEFLNTVSSLNPFALEYYVILLLMYYTLLFIIYFYV